MGRWRAGRAHAAVAVVLTAAFAFAVGVPIQGSDVGVLPAQGCTCHSDGPNFDVQIAVDGWPAIYTPDEAYPLIVHGEGPVTGAGGGFSVDVTKGSLSSTDPTVLASGNHATHTSGAKRSWPLLWIAPPEDSGNVRFTVFVNLVDGDGSDGPADLWSVLVLDAQEKAPEPPKPSSMVMAFAGPDEVAQAGHNFTVHATIANSTGAPIPNATVTFAAKLSWGVLPLGAGTTDPNGTARANWSVPAPGDFLVTAYYDGSSKNLSSNGSVQVTVYDPEGVWQDLYGGQEKGVWTWFDPVRVPLGLLVGGVWLTFFYATFHILRLRKAGAREADGPVDLIKLLFSRSGRGRR
ncbi:MAG TPA: choice-of-anchor V domain-containing protein [Candidatus Thermoplasmatota archaeon]